MNYTVTRIDSKGCVTKGYRADVFPLGSRFFATKKHGSDAAAKAWASVWRDEAKAFVAECNYTPKRLTQRRASMREQIDVKVRLCMKRDFPEHYHFLYKKAA